MITDVGLLGLARDVAFPLVQASSSWGALGTAVSPDHGDSRLNPEYSRLWLINYGSS